MRPDSRSGLLSGVCCSSRRVCSPALCPPVPYRVRSASACSCLGPFILSSGSAPPAREVDLSSAPAPPSPPRPLSHPVPREERCSMSAPVVPPILDSSSLEPPTVDLAGDQVPAPRVGAPDAHQPHSAAAPQAPRGPLAASPVVAPASRPGTSVAPVPVLSSRMDGSPPMPMCVGPVLLSRDP